jgi:PKD repeat protein
MMAYVSPNTLNPNVTVQFTDTSNNSPTSWDWSFGDINHSTSSAENPIFTYYGYNYYHVNLGVSNILGQSQSTATIGLCPLVASFTTNQTAGLVPLTVQFTDTSTNQPTSWLWNFGDGSTSTLQNPVHTYTTSGVYTVRLDATNTFGSCWDTTEITVSSLTSSFTANQTTGPLPLTVQFSDTSTDNPISWQWNFGDGSTSVQQNPVHTYVHNGTYLVNMASSNDYDTPVSAPTIQIFAYTPYVVSFSFTKSPVPNTNFTTVYFNDKSTGFYGPTSWSWTFGDGSASTQQNPTHQYTSYNQYNITLSATNSQGITGSYNATVKLP